MNEERVKELVEQFHNEDGKARENTAKALEEIGEKAVPALIDSIKAGAVVRLSAAFMIARFGGKAVSHLIQALKHPDDNVRTVVINALGEIGGNASPAVPALVEILKDPEETMRWGAAEALGQIGEKAFPAIPALAELLKDPVGYVRKSAVTALGKIGEKAAPALVTALKDKEPSVRGPAVEALHVIGLKSLPALVKAAKENPELRSEIHFIISTIGEEPDLGIKEGALEAPGKEDRFKRVLAVRSMKDRIPQRLEPGLEKARK